MFGNMKIGVRLALGFGLMVGLMAMIAFLGITRMASLNEGVDKMVNDRYPKTVQASEVIGNVNVIARAMRNILILDDPTAIQNERGRIEEARKIIKGNLDTLEATVKSDEGKKHLASVKEGRAKYVAASDSFLRLVEAGKQAEARVYLLGEMRHAQSAYFEVMTNLIKYQGGLMVQSGKDAAELYQSARSLILAITAAALVMAALIGFWVTRSITRPLNEAVTVANQLAEGDQNVMTDVLGHLDRRACYAATVRACVIRRERQLSQQFAELFPQSFAVQRHRYHRALCNSLTVKRRP